MMFKMLVENLSSRGIAEKDYARYLSLDISLYASEICINNFKHREQLEVDLKKWLTNEEIKRFFENLEIYSNNKASKISSLTCNAQDAFLTRNIPFREEVIDFYLMAGDLSFFFTLSQLSLS